MKIISLTRGMVSVVDDEDFESLNRHKWCAFKNKNGFYAVRNILVGDKKRLAYMHKVIMNAPRGQIVDHKSRNTLDNQKDNLRFATKGQNNANAGKRAHNTSGFKGVSWSVRQLAFNARCAGAHLGWFNSAEEAARAYDENAPLRFGEFAVTNQSLGLLSSPIDG